MGQPAREHRSILHRLRERVGSPLDWSNADKCVFTALIVLPVAALFNLWDYYLLTHPQVAPFVDREYLERFFPLHVGAFSGGWLVVLAAALWCRRRAPDTRALVEVVVHYYAIGFNLIAYVGGAFTSNFPGPVLLGGAAVAFLLFDRGPVLRAIASGVAIFLGTTLAAQAGLIPYAPFLAEAPFQAGRLSNFYLFAYGLTSFVIMYLGMALVYLIFYRWRDREEDLARMTDQLTRATELISRYVAAQVTEQILGGNYDAVDRPERRKLTIFFSDIKGFTETSERLEPEDLSDMLNEYLTEMTAIADEYGGTIDKFVGDAIMIFFGAPQATDDRDHALRAVRMAIAMQKRIGELREKWERDAIEHPFEVRMGINTGLASIGNFGSEGRMDYTAIGRQVNLTARLQVSCEPGKVLISHPTWALVHDEIPCTQKDEIRVKGIQHPLRVYEVDAA